MRYRAEIDGLRAIAVISVILFHAGFELFNGGFVGIDVFFVISGYLITSIILADMEKGEFSLINFYERRVRRILPALFFVMAICIPFAWMWLLPVPMKQFAQSLIAVSTFCINIFFQFSAGYFATTAELIPLLHTWSLAVEEQYYILFPLFLMLTWKLGKRWIISMLIAVTVISLSVANWGAYNQPTAAFYSLPTRGWEILLGAFLAFFLFHKQRNRETNTYSPTYSVSQSASLIGLALILFSIFAFDKQTPSPSLYTLVPTLGTLLVIAFTTQNTLSHRILRNRLLVGVGLMSYSAYLWHQPLLAFARRKSLTELSDLLLISLVIGALVLGYLTWHFIEKPFRNKDNFNQKTVFVLAAIASVTFIMFGLFGHINNGYRNRISMPPNVTWPDFSEKLSEKGEICHQQKIANFDGLRMCFFGAVNGKESIALYGDSHGQAISEQLDLVFKQKGIRGIRVNLVGCELVPTIVNINANLNGLHEKCSDRFSRLQKYLSQNTETVIVISRWTFRLFPVDNAIDVLHFDNEEGGRELVNYREYGSVQPNDKTSLKGEDKKQSIVDFIQGMAKVNRVVLVYPIPEIGWNIYKVNDEYYKHYGRLLSDLSFQKSLYIKRNRFVLNIFDELVALNENIRPVRSGVIFCEKFIKDRCVAQYETVPLYYDDDHLSDEGAKYIVEKIVAAVARN